MALKRIIYCIGFVYFFLRPDRQINKNLKLPQNTKSPYEHKIKVQNHHQQIHNDCKIENGMD